MASKRKPMFGLSPAAIILIGALITAFFGYYAQRQQDADDELDKQNLEKANKEIRKELFDTKKELSDQAKKNAFAQEERNSVIQDLQTKAVEQSTEYANKVDAYARSQKESDGRIIALQASQIEKAEEIARLNRELAQLSTETLNNVIAKDSYCCIHFTMSHISNKMSLIASHFGNYPLRNVEISIINTDEQFEETYSEGFTKNKFTSPEAFLSIQNPHKVKIEILSPGETIELNSFDVRKIDLKSQKSFFVYYRASNGAVWYQRVIIRRVKDFPVNSFVYKDERRQDEYLSANQLYTVDEKNTKDNIRYEIVLREGTDFLYYYPSGKLEETWNNFPRFQNELSPFIGIPMISKRNYDGLHKLHWSGYSRYGVEVGKRVNTTYKRY